MEYKEVRDQFLETLIFPYIFCNSTVSKYRKCMEKLRFSDLAFQIKDEERKLGHQTAAVALEYTRHLQ